MKTLSLTQYICYTLQYNLTVFLAILFTDIETIKRKAHRFFYTVVLRESDEVYRKRSIVKLIASLKNSLDGPDEALPNLAMFVSVCHINRVMRVDQDVSMMIQRQFVPSYTIFLFKKENIEWRYAVDNSKLGSELISMYIELTTTSERSIKHALGDEHFNLLKNGTIKEFYEAVRYIDIQE